MVEQIRKIVLRLFPELKAGYHLPRVAVVTGIADTPKKGDIADPFRPHYALNLKLLTEQGVIDEKVPELQAVPFSITGAGHEQGFVQYPEIGAWVEVCWLYGRPHLPYVRSVLPHYLTLSELEYGATAWQQSSHSKQHADAQGNWTRQTEGTITDQSRKHTIEALEELRDLQRALLKVVENSTEEVGGVKRIEALGALKLLSGGHANISALDNLNITSAAEIQETAGKLKRSFAKELQQLQVQDGGKVWLNPTTSYAYY